MSLSAEHLTFSYRGRPVLQDISLSLQEGELVCLLGQNGAGKTTLFKCLLGLLKGYEGAVLLSGKPLARLSPSAIAKEIAYIPQSHSAAFAYTVLDTVCMGLTASLAPFACPGKSEELAALAALDKLEIAHLAHRSYNEISGGEQQLTLIARALVQKTSILIMDEPTANLDYGNAAKVMHKAVALKNAGYLVLISTHNPEHALRYADRALVLQNGRLTHVGPPAEILTEQTLSALYGIPVQLARLAFAGGELTVCAPYIK